jgi:SAM-dependent methyltransferase
MQKLYWEKVSKNYNEEIFDVYANDRTGIIESGVIKYSSPKNTVCDIGCAVGKWLPLLSAHYKQVIAVDISEQNIGQARENHSSLGNVDFLRADLTTRAAEKIQPCDMALCVNAILTSSFTKRVAFFKAIAKCVKPGGHIILVVPSLESAMYSEFMYTQWNYKDGILPGVENSKDVPKKYSNLKQGVVELDSVPTKHYLEEELVINLKNEGCTVLETEKVQYTWQTEFVNPPRWMKAPYPWDWMVVAKKD